MFWEWIISRVREEICINRNQPIGRGYKHFSDHLKDAVQHASPSERKIPSSPPPPLFFRAALLVSCPAFDSTSLGSSPSGSGWASWFSLLSPPSWLLSDFLSVRSLLFSFSLREGGGFFPLLLRTFCCCWKMERPALNYTLRGWCNETRPFHS